MIENILERLEAEVTVPRMERMEERVGKKQTVGFGLGIRCAHAIVQEVAKEYDWIPCSERLPEPFQRVLVYDAWDDSMTIEHLQENDSFIDSVVAWMPLPIAPYQKGE